MAHVSLYEKCKRRRFYIVFKMGMGDKAYSTNFEVAN
jgi:hypothetical protein